MASIVPNQRVKHGGAVYEAGREYDVSDELAAHFAGAGWVGAPIVDQPTATPLSPDSVRQATNSKER